MLARLILGFVVSLVVLILQRNGIDVGSQHAGPQTVQPPTIQGEPALLVAEDGSLVEFPTVDIPRGYRVRNWAPYGAGSCVHASMVMLFGWQGQHDLAAYWRQSFHSGESFTGLATKLERVGVAWAGTVRGDVQFLEWSCRTRRGAAVVVSGGAHCVCLVHLDDVRAGVLDNNYPDRIKWVSRQAFLNEWRASGRWAVTPVYDPPSRLPFLIARGNG